VWLKFSKWLEENELILPVGLTEVTNFLSELKKKDGEYISYGSLRMHKATVINTLKLTGDLTCTNTAEEARVQALIDTVKRQQPDQARYTNTFDLDDVLTWLIEDYALTGHRFLRRNFASKDRRQHARKRAVVTLKLHGLFRSHDLLMARRGLLFSDISNQADTSCSRWGPMTELDDGTPCPEYVVLILSNTKATGKTEWRIDCMKGEAGLCPVAALFTYISMCKSQGDICTSLTSDDSIFLGITKSKDGSTMCYTSLTSPDPLAKDTKSIMTAAGVDEIYKAHALRSSVASQLLNQGVAELDIIHHARWSGTSVFRKYYENAKHTELTSADLLMKVKGPALLPASIPTVMELPPVVAPQTTEAPAGAETSLLPPRLNLTGPRGGKLKIPGTQLRDGISYHCFGCWNKDDHTMIWCRKCNKHLHASCFACEPSEAEAVHLGDGWTCDDCT